MNIVKLGTTRKNGLFYVLLISILVFSCSKYIEEMKSLRKEDELLDAAFKEVTDSSEKESTNIDFISLKSLQDDGIDMSFIGRIICDE